MVVCDYYADHEYLPVMPEIYLIAKLVSAVPGDRVELFILPVKNAACFHCFDFKFGTTIIFRARKLGFVNIRAASILPNLHGSRMIFTEYLMPDKSNKHHVTIGICKKITTLLFNHLTV